MLLITLGKAESVSSQLQVGWGEWGKGGLGGGRLVASGITHKA